MSGFLPYARQSIDEDDIAAVVEVLRGDWLTTGPAVERFEAAFAEAVGAAHAVAVSSGTAGLHLAVLVAGVGPGDEVIVPTMTFAASANCVRYVGGRVVFADCRPDTLGVDPDHVASLVTEQTKAIVAVDYAGVPADLDDLLTLADRHGLTVIEDACHAPGALYRGRRVGSISHLSTFSFHPVKHLTTGEGGMVTTNDGDLAARLRRLRNHGIDSDARQRQAAGTWEYDVAELGFNYRLSDLNCALGLAQTAKLSRWVQRRRDLAARYRTALADLPLRSITEPTDRRSAWHLYPVMLDGHDAAARRAAVFADLRSQGIGVNVHYRPVHLHSSFRALGWQAGQFPVAEDAYHRLLSLPMWPGMTDCDVDRVASALTPALVAQGEGIGDGPRQHA